MAKKKRVEQRDAEARAALSPDYDFIYDEDTTQDEMLAQVIAAFLRAEDQIERAMEAVIEAEDADDGLPEIDYTTLAEEDQTIQESLALIAQITARREKR